MCPWGQCRTWPAAGRGRHIVPETSRACRGGRRDGPVVGRRGRGARGAAAVRAAASVPGGGAVSRSGPILRAQRLGSAHDRHGGRAVVGVVPAAVPAGQQLWQLGARLRLRRRVWPHVRESQRALLPRGAEVRQPQTWVAQIFRQIHADAGIGGPVRALLSSGARLVTGWAAAQVVPAHDLEDSRGFLTTLHLEVVDLAAN
mmetsp:Transcript_125876/g.298822  ORF Transcript_125876/g.298822 Transcript_125876/m.298822 type:complete len:201 (-) Transcript_125876:1774-2376(-)